ncbi:MAG: acireductone synthase [Saprospiraceae bacterium]|nr:acireductone synthase [Saprospiraceae bacterium]
MIQYILTDIEGTTTDIAFVHKVLFPYACQKLPDFVHAHTSESTVSECIIETQHTLQEENQIETDLDKIIETLLHWIQEDRKHPALKRLQGMIWREGYETGAFKGHIYPDVVPQLENWRAQGLGIGIYSSGSVEAQKLLFGYSEYGDLNHLFDHNFDTAVGHKRETESYQNIAKALNLNSEQILFLSDIEAELDAAQEAGMQTIQVVREGTIPSKNHVNAINFAKIKL